MSKKFLVTSLAALSLSIFAGPSVFAEETGAVATESTSAEAGSQVQSLEELFAAAQALDAKLSSLFASEEPLPVSPENRQLLSDSINDVNNLLAALRDNGAKVEDAKDLFELRTNLAKLFLLQYEMPGLYEAILTQVPTLETKRYDDAVDFHDFDAELDSLLEKVAELDAILDFVQEDLEAEDVKKDKAYLNEVALYLIRLQEELYAPEGETVKVPEAPVYWNEEAVSGTDSQVGNEEETGSTETTEESGDQGSTEPGTDTGTESSSDTTDTGSTEVAEETGDQGSTEPGTDTGTESSSDITDTGSTEVAEETGDRGSTEPGTDSGTESSSDSTGPGSTESTEESSDQGSTEPGTDTGTESPSDTTDTGSTEVAEETGEGVPSDVTDTSAPVESGSTGRRSESSGSVNQGAGQTPPPAHVPDSPQQNQQSGQGQSGQTPSSTHQSTEASATAATSQTKAVLPTTADEANEFYLLAGLFLASLGLASMKRRQA